MVSSENGRKLQRENTETSCIPLSKLVAAFLQREKSVMISRCKLQRVSTKHPDTKTAASITTIQTKNARLGPNSATDRCIQKLDPVVKRNCSSINDRKRMPFRKYLQFACKRTCTQLEKTHFWNVVCVALVPFKNLNILFENLILRQGEHCC